MGLSSVPRFYKCPERIVLRIRKLLFFYGNFKLKMEKAMDSPAIIIPVI